MKLNKIVATVSGTFTGRDNMAMARVAAELPDGTTLFGFVPTEKTFAQSWTEAAPSAKLRKAVKAALVHAYEQVSASKYDFGTWEHEGVEVRVLNKSVNGNYNMAWMVTGEAGLPTSLAVGRLTFLAKTGTAYGLDNPTWKVNRGGFQFGLAAGPVAGITRINGQIVSIGGVMLAEVKYETDGKVSVSMKKTVAVDELQKLRVGYRSAAANQYQHRITALGYEIRGEIANQLRTLLGTTEQTEEAVETEAEEAEVVI